MTWRIRIVPDARIGDGGIAVQISRRVGDRGHTELLTFRQDTEVVAPEAVAMPTPSLTIPDDLGRALLDALAGFYGGTTGGLQQRADFEHERARVDRLIAHLTSRPAP